MHLASVAPIRVGAALAVLLAPSPLPAADWTVDDEASRIEFVVVVNGYPNRGVLPVFHGDGAFDPEALDASRFEIVIDMSALDMGNPIATSLAHSFDWFHVEAHPTAVFRLDRISPSEDGMFVASGALHLRGVENAVSTPLEMTLDAQAARAKGEAVLNRHDFGIGQGPSTLFMQVDPEITVRFELTGRLAAGNETQNN